MSDASATSGGHARRGGSGGRGAPGVVRLFVAIDVPEALKQAIESDVVRAMRDAVPGARWTKPESRHLTLKFLGNVDDERVDDISGAIRSASQRHAAFRASFAEVGAFPNAHRPRVLWVGVGEGSAAMSALAGDLERDLDPLGFPPEGRPFRGHLTLARFPRPRVVDELPSVPVPPDAFDVNATVLYRSQLHPKGARYTPLERFPLER